MHQVRQHTSAFGIRRGQEKQRRSQKSMQGVPWRAREKRWFIRLRGIRQDRRKPETFGIQTARSDTRIAAQRLSWRAYIHKESRGLKTAAFFLFRLGCVVSGTFCSNRCKEKRPKRKDLS